MKFDPLGLPIGFYSRFGDFFEFFSTMQECKREVAILSSRIARYNENYLGRYTYGNNTKYDEAELSHIFIAEVLRMSHRVNYNCLYAWKIDVYENSLRQLAEKGSMYNVHNWLKNDFFMFEDVYEIAQITVQGYMDGTVTINRGHWILVYVQYLNGEVGSMEGANNQPLLAGIDYFELGARFGDIVGRLSVDLYA